jgi:nucleotide-binding universal stress UspA family protein
MFRNILVSLDGSRHAEQALGEAIDIALAERSRLTLLTAVPKPSPWSCAALAVPSPMVLAGDLERESQAILRAAADRVPDSVPITTILTHRPIREALSRQLQSGRYDLLVMGCRGRGALSASTLGSVSHYALNHSRIPMLVVHNEDEAERERVGARASRVAGDVPQRAKLGRFSLPRLLQPLRRGPAQP